MFNVGDKNINVASGHFYFSLYHRPSEIHISLAFKNIEHPNQSASEAGLSLPMLFVTN